MTNLRSLLVSKIRLSNSSINKFLSCPFKYKLHYLHKIRPDHKSGALLFGSALDEAMNVLLTSRDKEKAIEKFESEWEYGVIIRKKEHLPASTQIRYAKSDFDADLLSDFDLETLKDKSDDPLKHYLDIQKRKEQQGYINLSKEEQQFMNFANWLVLRRKGLLMIDAYCEQILPRIKKVYKVQKQLSIDNGGGDTIIGYIDLVADIETDDGEIVKAVLDNKTSSRDYAWDSVRTSQQLALYSEIEDLEYAGYLVLYKNVKKNKKKVCSVCGYQAPKGSRVKTCDNEINGKRCKGAWDETIDPQIKTDIIIDKVSDTLKESVLDVAEQVLKGIKAEIFPKNFQSCDNFFGCEYRQFCFYGDDEGLIKV
jgi:hypothetical protein